MVWYGAFFTLAYVQHEHLAISVCVRVGYLPGYNPWQWLEWGCGSQEDQIAKTHSFHGAACVRSIDWRIPSETGRKSIVLFFLTVNFLKSTETSSDPSGCCSSWLMVWRGGSHNCPVLYWEWTGTWFALFPGSSEASSWVRVLPRTNISHSRFLLGP